MDVTSEAESVLPASAAIRLSTAVTIDAAMGTICVACVIHAVTPAHPQRATTAKNAEASKSAREQITRVLPFICFSFFSRTNPEFLFRRNTGMADWKCSEEKEFACGRTRRRPLGR